MEDEPELAYKILADLAKDFPDDGKPLYLLGRLHARADRHAEALAIFERCSRLNAKQKAVWNSMGQVLTEMGKHAAGREAFQKSIALKPEALFFANVASTYLSEGNPVESLRWCKKALAIDPQHSGALANMGFAQLAVGDWTGWRNVEESLGGIFRKRMQFGEEGQWDLSRIADLIVYGEQGLGDEIMYCSCLKDVGKMVDHVTVECDTRLGGLFTRSFPFAEIHATRRIERDWSDDRVFGGSLAMGSMPSVVRPTRESCPRTPYLVADPERRVQWRALFDLFKKPVIGLAWSGGNYRTGKSKRTVGIEAFRGLIQSNDAVFVSLQYKDPTEEIEASGLPIRHYRRATLTDDYDDTAGMVAELDMVVGIHTTVHHLAGALGVPSVVLVPSVPLWCYQHGDRIPWYQSQMYHRQKRDESWQDCVNRIPKPLVPR